MMDTVTSQSCAQPATTTHNVPSHVLDVHDGYPALAWLMGSKPDQAIFRTFNELTILNLLRLQAELQDMERQLQVTRQEDITSGDADREAYAKDFRTMRDNKDDGDSEQYDQLVEIGKKLQEYHSALATILRLRLTEEPTKEEVDRLKSWLARPKGGKAFLAGEEANVWTQEDLSEYVTLLPRSVDRDAFSSFLGGKLLDIYHSLVGHRRRKRYSTDPRGVDVRTYSAKKLKKASNITVAIVSSLLPAVVILALYFVKRMIVRIGLVILFTFMFSIAIAIFTAARKVEIFSATAAFAAVEVVYIGSSSTNSTG